MKLPVPAKNIMLRPAASPHSNFLLLTNAPKKNTRWRVALYVDRPTLKRSAFCRSMRGDNEFKKIDDAFMQISRRKLKRQNTGGKSAEKKMQSKITYMPTWLIHHSIQYQLEYKSTLYFIVLR